VNAVPGPDDGARPVERVDDGQQRSPEKRRGRAGEVLSWVLATVGLIIVLGEISMSVLST
jgi:hypothetical protein